MADSLGTEAAVCAQTGSVVILIVSTGGGVPLNTTLPDTLPAVAVSTGLPGFDVAAGGGTSLPPHAATRPNDARTRDETIRGSRANCVDIKSYRANQAENVTARIMTDLTLRAPGCYFAGFDLRAGIV